MADTQELIKATKEDPAIASLEAGTQEAFDYLADLSRQQQGETKNVEARKAQVDANTAAWQAKLLEWQARIKQAFEDNATRKKR